MLYLEDYLELIEQLPQDLRDRFTEMRELDLKVQNAIDTMDSKVEKFFKEAKDAKPEVHKQEYNKIKENYDKALEDADEKVTMASQIFDLVDRHLRKLDQELSKFKMELEADCAGITEVLEKRSLMYDDKPASDDFNYASPYQNHESHDKKKNDIDRYAALNGFASSNEAATVVAAAASPMQPTYNSLPASPQTVLHDYPASSSSLSYTLGHVGAGSAAIAAAAKQAVTSTMQQHQGRRGAQASFKASVATAMKAEQLSNSLQSLLGTTPTSLTRSQNYVDVISSNRYQSSLSPKTVSENSMTPQSTSQKSRKRNRTVTTTPIAPSTVPVVEEPAMGSSLDWVPEPNEPTYCLCNQVSYGEMVGCDNPDCPIEWFHYGCVGLTDAPEGKWYCPRCTLRMKKRKAR